MIDLRRLHMLRLLDQLGTVTATAEALRLTPSAVSHHLRELSRELKVPLLEPDGRRVRLTPAAAVLLGHADGLFAGWERTLADLDAHRAGRTGPLRFAGFTTAVSGLIAPAAGALRRDEPGLGVAVRECDTAPALGLLAAGDVDIAVIEGGEDGSPPGDVRFARTELLEERYDLIVAAGHPLAGSSGTGLGAAAGETWVVVEPETCAHHRQVTAYCTAAGFLPRIEHAATTWAGIWSLVAHGLGVSLVPRLADGPAGTPVSRVPLTGPAVPTRRVLAAVRAGSAGQPLIARGLAALRAAVPEHCRFVAA
ncbi:LysR family transcriptional regulator [Actinomadura flavalba]|uniref:LysR family transcriptional regulator n=1 Tax=Actinomadura flavalba TaxID=1120938 RepID=UPI001F0B708B|nr:LysR family transcriptional regulator [Actinomadura flavalba]